MVVPADDNMPRIIQSVDLLHQCTILHFAAEEIDEIGMILNREREINAHSNDVMAYLELPSRPFHCKSLANFVGVSIHFDNIVIVKDLLFKEARS